METLRHKIPPRSPRRPPGKRQEGPKESPRWFQESPRRPHEGCNTWPRAPQQRPSNPQERPNAAPDANTTKSLILTTFSKGFVVFQWSGRSQMAENWPQSDLRREKKAEKAPRESRYKQNCVPRRGRNHKIDDSMRQNGPGTFWECCGVGIFRPRWPPAKNLRSLDSK